MVHLDYNEYRDMKTSWSDLVEYHQWAFSNNFEENTEDDFEVIELKQDIEKVVEYLENYRFTLHHYNKTKDMDGLDGDLFFYRKFIIIDKDLIVEEGTVLLTFFDKSRQFIDVKNYLHEIF